MFTEKQRKKLLERFEIDCDVKNHYPITVLDKILKLNLVLSIYFKSQIAAADFLGVKQPNIWRYKRGVIALPHERATKLEDFTNKAVLVEEIRFTKDDF